MQKKIYICESWYTFAVCDFSFLSYLGGRRVWSQRANSPSVLSRNKIPKGNPPVNSVHSLSPDGLQKKGSLYPPKISCLSHVSLLPPTISNPSPTPSTSMVWPPPHHSPPSYCIAIPTALNKQYLF